MAERSRDWMDQARRDLESAQWQAQGGYYEWACFVAQQAAEKAIKAVYQRRGGDAWGHALADLLSGLAERVAVPAEIVECARLLDRFYIPTRYPNAWVQGAPGRYYTEEDARRAIGCGEAILRFCQGLLAEP
jgi:HEPN domain-containing protein